MKGGVPDSGTVGKKTTYDPATWTDAQLAKSATEAWKDPGKVFFNMPPQNIRSWRGKDSNGNTIVGHVLPDGTDPNMSTFWPE